MLAVVLALASAVGYGGSDFAAGLASRSAGVIQVTLLASAVSAIVVTAALPFAASHPPGGAALAWGAVAGLGGTRVRSRCTSGSGMRRSASPGR